jgi:amino acid transporter
MANLLSARIIMWAQALHFVPFFPGGAGGFAVVSSPLPFTVLGANAAVELSEEIIEPRRNSPLSFLISIPAVVAIYAGIGVVAASIEPWRP